MSELLVAAHGVSARYGTRVVFRDVSFELGTSQSLGVIGPNGAGKTTLLRMLAGLLSPWNGQVHVRGRHPRDAGSHIETAYFAGDFTLPGSVRACHWASLATGDIITPERRRVRTLSRGTRQLLGLRTVLSRPQAGVVLLDEPWEALDADARRWLSRTLEAKRDRGAAIILASHDLDDLAGICDAYLFLVYGHGTLCKAHELTSLGPVTAALLANVLERLLIETAIPLRAVS